MTQRSKILGALVALVVILGLGAVGAWSALVYLDRSHPTEKTDVIVPPGASFSDIAALLEERGVIGNSFAFRILARLRHADVEVRAGAYAFAPHATAAEILEQLVTGGAQIATWVTIPEGYRDSQIAHRLAAEGVGAAEAFERSFRTTSLDVDGTRTRGLEGFLFPSTYLVPLDATPAQVARQLTDQFFKELPSDAAQRARALHVTVPQAVTVASLVEREAKIDADRPLIAAVIYNRLRLGMPLQIDATIEYALPRYKSELSLHDLQVDSPYNTYRHDGLPPTPIANPGLPSLEAALHPAKTDALYYVYCGNGHHAFASTLAQHQANVARCLH
ncbi:MAG TPA: endolytic transglycosylase MltG [Candidatus Baltobacteraceae bacterium]|nr:endolytic transglycosylase MltG [Candidatus Baltobacteraceae bacterium]